MTSTLIMRREDLGISWAQLDHPSKVNSTTTGVGMAGPLTSQWPVDGKNLVAHIASTMPTPPESPPPSHQAAAIVTSVCDPHYQESPVETPYSLYPPLI